MASMEKLAVLVNTFGSSLISVGREVGLEVVLNKSQVSQGVNVANICVASLIGIVGSGTQGTAVIMLNREGFNAVVTAMSGGMIKADIADPWMVKDHNIKEIECVLVSKKKLQKYFEEQGLTHEKLKEITEHMRKDSSYRAPYNPEFRFYYSPQLAEKPINILLNKEVYIRLGEFHYFVTPN